MIPFTQYKFPDGRRVPESIERPVIIEALAKELIEAGWQFEIEIFPDTKLVNMDCCNDDEQLACEQCTNGPAVPTCVDELVQDAHANWMARGKPKA